MNRARDIIQWVIARLLAHDDSITQELAISVEREALAQWATAEQDDGCGAVVPGQRTADEVEPVAPRAQQVLDALAYLPAAQLPPELEPLRRGVAAYWQGAGHISLDRALGMPTGTQHRRLRREQHLREALRLLEPSFPYPSTRAVELERLLQAMASRGVWHRWQRNGGPPADATPLSRHVFEALSMGPDPSRPHTVGDRTLRTLASSMERGG